MFIVFEGPEGCGKSTQAQLAGEALNKAGHQTLITREPGGSAFGEKLRDILLGSTDPICLRAEVLTYMASRAQIVAETIRPAIEEGKIVICERFISSTIAYQGAAGGESIDAIETLGAYATNGLKPDLTLIIDIDAKEGLSRAGSLDRIEKRGEEYHNKVRQEFLDMVKTTPDKFALIDGAKTVVEVNTEIMTVIKKRLKIS